MEPCISPPILELWRYADFAFLIRSTSSMPVSG